MSTFFPVQIAKTLQDFDNGLEDGRFTDSDKNRFYRVHPLDSSTVVTLNQVILVSTAASRRETKFKVQSSNGVHAEKLIVQHIKRLKNERLRETPRLKKVRLVTMATASPCSKCREALREMLENWRTKGLEVHYTYRISYFYYESRMKEKLIKELRQWKIALREIGVKFKFQAITVREELRRHKIRQVRCEPCKTAKCKKLGPTQCKKCTELQDNCLRKRERADEKM